MNDSTGTGQQAPVVNTTVRIRGQDYDLLKCLPLTLGDWERLEELGIMAGDRIQAASAKHIVGLIHVLVSKIDPALQRVDITSIPISDLPRMALVLERIAKEGTDMLTENPTEAKSTT